MSKKLFSLIYGDSVRVAPKAKIVPANEFSRMAEASEILKQIREEADRYRLEVAKECEILKETAQKEGFEEGSKQWAEHIAKLEEEIHKVRKDLEKRIIPVALKAAKKIVGREMELSEKTVVDIVANNLKAVSQHKKITIYVNRADLETLEKDKNELKALFEQLEAFSIQERDDIMQGGCVIETEAGIINAQIDNQWRVLENAFETLIKQGVS